MSDDLNNAKAYADMLGTALDSIARVSLPFPGRNARIAVVPSKPRTSGFACQECGHKFKTLKGAEKASFGVKGCPKCGGSDIDLGGV